MQVMDVLDERPRGLEGTHGLSWKRSWTSWEGLVVLRHASNGQDVASRLLSTQLFASHAVTRTVEYLTPGPASRIRADLPGLQESHPSRSQALPRLRLVRQPGCAPQSVPAMQCLPRHKPTPPPLVTTSPSEARCRSLLSPLARAGAAAFFSSLLFRDCLGLIWPIWLIAPLFYLVHHSSRLHGPTGKQRKKRKKSFDEAASPVGTSCHTHTHTHAILSCYHRLSGFARVVWSQIGRFAAVEPPPTSATGTIDSHIRRLRSFFLTFLTPPNEGQQRRSAVFALYSQDQERH